MKTLLQSSLPILTASVLFIATSARAGNTTYVWTSTFGSNPEGFAGTIVVDSSSSPPSGGTERDIVSISLSEIGEPTFNVALPGDIDQFTSMTCTLTGLTPRMVLYDGGDGFQWGLYPGGIDTESGLGVLSPTDDGSWEVQTAVPEPPPVALLLFGLPGVFVFARYHRPGSA